MKTLIKFGLAAAMVFATAMPAMAKSWVVCLDQNKDATLLGRNHDAGADGNT